jgi:hypothetical protein
MYNYYHMYAQVMLFPGEYNAKEQPDKILQAYGILER